MLCIWALQKRVWKVRGLDLCSTRTLLCFWNIIDNIISWGFITLWGVERSVVLPGRYYVEIELIECLLSTDELNKREHSNGLQWLGWFSLCSWWPSASLQVLCANKGLLHNIKTHNCHVPKCNSGQHWAWALCPCLKLCLESWSNPWCARHSCYSQTQVCSRSGSPWEQEVQARCSQGTVCYGLQYLPAFIVVMLSLNGRTSAPEVCKWKDDQLLLLGT